MIGTGLQTCCDVAMLVRKVQTKVVCEGTTARPKGVIHTHVSLMGATGLTSSLGLDETHATGGKVVSLPAFDAAKCLNLIEHWQCSYLFILPAMLQLVVEVLERRLCTAQHLLRQSRISLADLALGCGFSSQSYLTDIFRQQLGITPQQYRRSGSHKS